MNCVFLEELTKATWSRPFHPGVAVLVVSSVCLSPIEGRSAPWTGVPTDPVPSEVCGSLLNYDLDLAIPLIDHMQTLLGEPAALDSTESLDLCRSGQWSLEAMPHRHSSTESSNGPDPGWGWGTGIYNLTEDYYPDYGVEAKQRVYSSQFLPEGPPVYYLYAPTLEPPCAKSGNQYVYHGRYESVVWYKNYGRTPRNMWAVYEHCGASGTGAFILVKAIDSTFLANYVSGGYIYTQVWHIVLFGTPTWSVWLYNYSTLQWELQVWDVDSTCKYPHQHPVGWDWFEWDSVYGPDSSEECVDVPQIRSFGLRLYVDGAWTYVTSSFGYEMEIDWLCTDYDTEFSSEFYNWYVESP
ncbi:MAG: hypothetical protein FJ109_03850 [Deltaproteobacteria bacterium]|nr:hypothetical protein [Deltaproteobacteria bacterium]